MTARALPYLEEDDRLLPKLTNLRFVIQEVILCSPTLMDPCNWSEHYNLQLGYWCRHGNENIYGQVMLHYKDFNTGSNRGGFKGKRIKLDEKALNKR